MTVAELAKRLESSPLFNLSLSSKELFHSNFLKWLWETYPVHVQAALQNTLSSWPDPQHFKAIHREKLNIDLMVEYSSGHRIVIENKVKSFSYLEQLDDYGKKFLDSKDTDFLLLSLVRPEFVDEFGKVKTGDAVWQFVSYDELANGLDKCLLPAIDDVYHHQLVRDYLEFIRNLSSLVDKRLIVWNHDENFFTPSDPDLVRIRLNDLDQKLRYAQLANKVSEKIGPRAVRKDWRQGQMGEIIVASGLTRGIGLFDFKYVIERIVDDLSPLVVGVQIQGNDFRLYSELISVKRNPNKIAEKLHEEKLWFDFGLSTEIKNIDKEYPTTKNKRFNQYGETFFYKSKRIEKITLNRIVDIVGEYIYYLDNNIDNIREVVQG